MDKLKCLDTYALIEIINGNPKFAKYLNSKFIINDLTLAELYSVLLREFNEQTADYWFNKFENYSLVADKVILKEAIKFKYFNKKKRISFFDAVGYMFALKNGALFVTGDKEFENFENVEFKKK